MSNAYNTYVGPNYFAGGGGGGSTPVAVGITAFSGGGQADATQLDYGYSSINAGFASGDSVALPPAVAGKICTVIVEGGSVAAAFLSIWPKNGSTDILNGIAASDATLGGVMSVSSLANAAIFVCAVDGAWFCNCPIDD